ncbi:MAG: hypothetical protein VB050_16100 [Geobacteraceae bacterium]|nr:hypothetical protein [Geobacteraceae bacterium]
MNLKPVSKMICLLFFLLTFELLIASFPTEEIFAECNDEWRFLVAQPPSAWPAHTTSNTVPIEQLSSFSIRIPVGFEKIYRVANLLIFSYGNKTASVSFEEISRDTIPDLPKDTCMTMGDIGHAIFTKTPRDQRPGCESLWQWGLRSKSVYFRKNVPVSCAKKKHLTVYYYTSVDKFDPAKPGGVAVVINDKRPDSFAVIRAVGIDVLRFKNIIGSIDEVQRGR